MTRTMKHLIENKKGQAFPLAAIGVFIMALSVIATMNLGQAIHEKIKLQGAADAASYSLASMEARAFNFVAMLNRTMVVNYNTAMAVQSYYNYAGFCLFLLGSVRDLLACMVSSLDFGCTYIKLPPWLNAAYCILKAIFTAVNQIVSAILRVVDYLVNKLPVLGLHSISAGVADALGLMNKYMLWQMQLIRLALVNAHILSGMHQVVSDNYIHPQTGESKWRFELTPWMFLNMALNTLEYRAAFDRGAGVNASAFDLLLLGWRDYGDFGKRQTDASKDAVRIMSEIANATRSHAAIYNRKRGLFASWIVSNIFGDKMGATKLIPTGSDSKPNPDVRKIRSADNYELGDVLASDDYLTRGWGIATVGISVVFAQSSTIKGIAHAITAYGEDSSDNNRKHYGYKNNNGDPAHPKGGYSGLIVIPPMKKSAKKSIQKEVDCSLMEKHKWIGISPYFKFMPIADHNSDYGQPSTWIFLNMPPEKFQTGTGVAGRPWHKKFTFNHGGGDKFSQDNLGTGQAGEHGGHSADLDTTIGGERNSMSLFGMHLEGLNVISRGMVYYHRQGNWGEPPNFFNPFWRAKLAPVGAKLAQWLDNLTRGIVKPGSADESTSQTVVRVVLNLFRNFLGDVFFGFITSVMTH
ncbi:Tad domain-containing protein [Myxococcota bacterium]|nr:Tad domain-containing protein [Myxococcota bacterium]MBU1411707.1 Tad domain-containing protein [Myxococcota bacterium]MBU1512108.1 Tad domain-containing protein [Myxococcota bacterium]